MRKPFNIILIILIGAGTLIHSGCKRSAPVLKNNNMYLEFSEDLSGIKSLIDIKTGRNYASGMNSFIYTLKFGNHYSDTLMITPDLASACSFSKLNDTLELHYRYEGKITLNVICKIYLDESASLIKWSIDIDNKSQMTLCSIIYPLISCQGTLGAKPEDDGVVFPTHEGVLLTGLKKAGSGNRCIYPGTASAQLLYYFDPDGGIYYAAHDGNGNRKAFNVSNFKGSIRLSQEYFLPIEFQKKIKLPYSVVTGFSGGRWEDGARIYRGWAEKQEWCANTLENKDTPDWLKKPVMFVRFGCREKGFESVSYADLILKKYHDYYDIPVIATGFSWEKNGIWIGPDYFPPVHGEKYYSDLSSRLNKRGDHLHVFTSGFRWGVKKPKTERKGEKEFTSFDGLDLFMKEGKRLAVINNKNELIFEKRAWAYNYAICAGSEPAKALFDSVFNRIFKMGITGADLDQNLGGYVDDCFSRYHGHPVGAGLWQYNSMNKFLNDVRINARKISGDNFIGVEEPCEIYIPQFDVFHGRCFTLNNWPVYGPGAVSIPLYPFLYHQYEIGYSGWLDGFIALGNVKNSIGRSFIFGYYPGIGTRGKFDLRNIEISDESKIMKGYVSIYKRNPEFFLNGKMQGEIQIKGCDLLNIEKDGIIFPVKWSTTQGIIWESSAGVKLAYAICNLSDKSQDIKIKLENNFDKTYELTGYVLDQEVKQNLNPDKDGWLAITMEPWQLSIIK